MVDILHRVGIKADPKVVFDALTTIEGLSKWWVVNTTGNPKLGGIINFDFCEMKVVELIQNKLVKWQCVSGPKEWLNTEITFELEDKDQQTFILFKHAKWQKPVEFMHHCSTKWAIFLLSLKSWLEREEGRPYPYDVKIHMGD